MVKPTLPSSRKKRSFGANRDSESFSGGLQSIKKMLLGLPTLIDAVMDESKCGSKISMKTNRLPTELVNAKTADAENLDAKEIVPSKLRNIGRTPSSWGLQLTYITRLFLKENV